MAFRRRGTVSFLLTMLTFFAASTGMMAATSHGRSGCSGNATLTVDPQQLLIELDETATVDFLVQGCVTNETTITFTTTPEELNIIEPLVNFTISENNGAQSFNVTLVSIHEGKITITAQADTDHVDVSEAFVLLSVMKDPGYDTAAMVLGWVSTIAWDISFLPQIWHNYRRHTVAGLSFDFLTFNFLGFACYFMFNAGMFWIPAIQDEFRSRHPNELLHVRLNDVIFPLYAVICTAVQIIQCFFYKRDAGQRVSIPCRVISSILLLLVIIGCILVPCLESILWIDILYFMSYVKLFISTIKYFPQLYTNFKAKSTAGWNIWQVILDFSGGSLSIIQMCLLAANYDDYNSMLTDPTKLGLGMLSIFFNIFFFMQHYWLYRGNEHPSSEEEEKEEDGGSVKSNSGSKGKYDRF